MWLSVSLDLAGPEYHLVHSVCEVCSWLSVEGERGNQTAARLLWRILCQISKCHSSLSVCSMYANMTLECIIPHKINLVITFLTHVPCDLCTLLCTIYIWNTLWTLCAVYYSTDHTLLSSKVHCYENLWTQLTVFLLHCHTLSCKVDTIQTPSIYIVHMCSYFTQSIVPRLAMISWFRVTLSSLSPGQPVLLSSTWAHTLSWEAHTPRNMHSY